ncbi:MAG: hypothetical protein FK733_02325 [Asgard group archaeon]|nr:hypothetical protein [Asgard group archaeon]
MKKSTVFTVVLLLVMFSSLFTIEYIGQPFIIASQAVIDTSDVISNFMSETIQYVGENETYINNMTTGFSITIDGNLSDWDGAKHAEIYNTDIYFGYDSNYFYVAAQWDEESFDDDVSLWEKIGVDENGSVWEFIQGDDDQFAFGITSEDADADDLWIWTASTNRTNVYAYECNSTFYADSGTLPHIENEELDVDGFGLRPKFENDGVTKPNYETDPIGTQYWGWIPQTPTGSQTDVVVAADWNNTKEGHYTIEMIRLLNTGNPDDIVFDPTNLEDHQMFIGRNVNNPCYDMEMFLEDHTISDQNTPATLQFSKIPSIVDEMLIISGNASDDYARTRLKVHLSGWEDTHYGIRYRTIDINSHTGEWVYFFDYDEEEMPLGDWTVNVTLFPMYEDPIMIYQNITIEDNNPPIIDGVVDIGENFPYGVDIYDPIFMVTNGTLPITIGIRDDYYENVDLICELYWWKDDGVALMIPMTQFYPEGAIFTADMPILYEIDADNIYTYFISVWDGSLNKINTNYYTFNVYMGEETISAPGFGILIGLFGLTGAAFLLYKKFKK